MKSVTNIFLICGLCLAAISVEGSASSQLRRSTIHKALQPGHTTEPEPKDPHEDLNPVEKVGKKMRKHQKTLMGAIDKFRAEVCAKMKDEFGVEFSTFEACHKFMEKTCKPGKDMKMDGDSKEVSSGEGFCHEYFPEAEKKAEKEVEEEEAPVHEVVSGLSPGPAPAPGPAPQPSAPAKAEAAPAPAKAEEAAAPAPAPASAAASGGSPAPGPMGAPGPAPGPVPGPFTPGITGGKPWGKISKDETYYYKDDGKDMARMHMTEKMKLPENGYWGKLVEHDDGETQTGDWGKEFGPKSGHASFYKICRDNPDNQWCRTRFGHKSSTTPAALSQLVPVAIALLAFAL